MIAVCVAAALASAGFAGANVTKETVTIDSAKRAYYLFVPDTVGSEPVPLLIAFHGSGRDGRSIVDPWRDIAAREKFIVAGPDATIRAGWQVPDDGPAFLYFLVEAVKAKHSIDSSRVYLFGHSAGAHFSVLMGLLETEYFAAVAVHAGALKRTQREELLRGPRKIPILFIHGTKDPLVPIEHARESAQTLRERGYPVDLIEIPGHDHNYYVRSGPINDKAWAFLAPAALADGPRWQPYSYPPKHR